jgi:hypothetical protein
MNWKRSRRVQASARRPGFPFRFGQELVNKDGFCEEKVRLTGEYNTATETFSHAGLCQWEEVEQCPEMETRPSAAAGVRPP